MGTAGHRLGESFGGAVSNVVAVASAGVVEMNTGLAVDAAVGKGIWLLHEARSQIPKFKMQYAFNLELAQRTVGPE